MELLHLIDFHKGIYENINEKEGKRDIKGEKTQEKFEKINKKKILQLIQSVTITKSGCNWPNKVSIAL